ncbi:MAG: hypothetical protein LBG57_02840 [Treponema sp.]|jgi:hypothetical protein|nr:hypothetical protein [Treponema sp.]
MKILIFRKSKATKKPDTSSAPAPDNKLEYFRKLLLDHLDTLDDGVMEKAGLPIGTIREWKGGRKYIKIGPGKWRPKYDSESRGAKMAISSIKKKIDQATTARELMDIVMENRDRFSDAQGNPLPFVQELHQYVEQRHEYLPENIAAKRKEARSNAIKAGKEKARERKEEARKAAEENIRQKTEKMKAQKNKQGADDSELSEDPESEKRTPEDYKLNYVDMINGKRVFNDKKYIHVGTEGTTNESVAFIDKDGSVRFYFNNTPEKIKNEIMEEAKKLYGKAKLKGEGNEQTNNSDSQDDIDFQAIKDKYQGVKSIEGNEDEIYVGDEVLKGKWKLVEADAPSASHDETTFHKTRGFPTNKDGSTINDRDYQNDKAAQETVISMGSNFDGRALSFDSPVVVTRDGIVVSGNNRTMSSKIAARKGADTKYIDALKKRTARFGFTGEDVDGFKHPRVIFEIEKEGGYSTGEFAKHNQESQKTMSPIEAAVKVSKIIKAEMVKDIAGHIVDFDTMGELYADHKTCMNIFNFLENGGIINQFNRNSYIDRDGAITGAGKEFLETVLIGSVVNEQNIRGLNREGCKHIRAKLVRAIIPLVNNKSMGGYSIMEELNQAIDLFMQFNIEKDKFGTLDDLVKQGTMFETPSGVAVELARRMQMNQKDFAEFMQKINASLELGTSGQSDIFLGDVETKDAILKRFLDIKKSIDGALRFFSGLGKGRGSFDRKKVILNRAGEAIEDYRWIMKKAEPDVQLILYKQAVEPHAELIQEGCGGEKTIAVDFDGVINSYKSGWKGPTETDEPVLSAAEGISGLWNRGYKIIIFSTRANTPEGSDTIREYIRRHTENDLLANSIEITDRKPIADVYIDDRAIQFTGNWDETLEQIETFKPWIEKSLTYSGYPLQGRTRVQGMDISIENKKGSTRSGTDKDGHDWSVTMNYDYGYIRGTVGVDKDHLDAYVGPNPESEIVYIVNQNDPVTGKFDEQKVMLGFNSEAEAKAAYLRQYDRPGFLGNIVKMDIDTFKEKVFDMGNKGKPIQKATS